MRNACLAAFLTLVAFSPTRAADEILPGYRLPKDPGSWPEARRELRRTVVEILGIPDGELPRPKSVAWTDLPGDQGPLRRSAEIHDSEGTTWTARLALPRNVADLKTVPAVIYLHDKGTGLANEIDTPGPTGKPPAEEFTRRGFAVLCVDVPFLDSLHPWTDATTIGSRPAWGAVVRADVLSMSALLSRSEIDPNRIAAVGHGVGGSRALWLAAVDDRIANPHAIGGMTRLSNWLNAHRQAPAPWVSQLFQKKIDTDAVAALIAPRPFSTHWGSLDPEAPEHGVETIRAVYESALRFDRSGRYRPHFHARYGDVGGEFTLLAWDGVMEFLDKPLMPQVATPLPHPPEPEPKVDERFLNLAEHGIAGWVPEMSQRPGTWTWENGVIRCRPGNNEYGWLRAPIEVDDFILSIEWKVPKRGNSGIFLRSKPVFWTMPSTASGQLRVSSLGLEWPSRSGFELQAADDPTPPSKYSTGALYRHAAPSALAAKPANEWNRYTVRARGPRIEVWLNGQQIQDTRADTLPTLRTVPLRGYIGVQNHGNGAEFRNVRYLRLEPSPES